ncbi:HAMP domain-containing protein, partial [Ciceribacter naphthalenivorans]
MRFTIKLKLAISFGAIIFMMLGTSIYAINSLGTLSDAINNVISGPAARLAKAQELSILQLRFTRSQINMATADNLESVERSIGNSDNYRQSFRDTVAWLEGNASTEEGKANWREVEAMGDELMLVDDAVRNYARAGNYDAAVQKTKTDGRQLTDKIGEFIDARVEAGKLQMQKAAEDTEALYAATRRLILGISAGAALVAIGAALWMALGISSGLRKIATATSAVAIGDLDQRLEIKSNDEIKDVVDTVNVMTSNLRATAQVADRIAAGDLTTEAKPLSDKDTLGLAMQSMITNLRTTADVAGRIAEGDLSITPQPLSDKDMLGNAMLGMVGNLRKTSEVANEIANGNLTVNPKPLSDRDTLGLAL